MALTKLKIAILEKGLTQKMVAQKAGIHESTLSQIARGTYVPELPEGLTCQTRSRRSSYHVRSMWKQRNFLTMSNDNIVWTSQAL
jgi:hypothetical protein